MNPARTLLIAVAFALALAPTAHADDTAIYYPGRWQLTQYWIATEHPAVAATHHRPVPVRTRDGDVLAYTGADFYADLCMEGTGRLWDGRLLNWDQRVGRQACFVEVDRDAYPFGLGVAGYSLVPFRSLAVDRRFIPIGHTVEIADLAGTPLPDGSVHDGCFVAVDGGGAINGHHIDLFLPSADAWRELGRAGYLPAHVNQVIVDSPRCRYARRYAVVPLPTTPALPR